jgi:hypothetical protein
MDVFDNIYKGAAAVGTIRATLGAVIGSIIAFGLVAVGIWILWDNYSWGKDTNAKVNLASDCTPNASCRTNVTYMANGKQYTHDFFSPTSYKQGAIITVWFDKANPDMATIDLPPATWGWGLIGGAVALVLLVWGVRWLAFNFQPFAAFEGGLTAWEFFR